MPLDVEDPRTNLRWLAMFVPILEALEDVLKSCKQFS